MRRFPVAFAASALVHGALVLLLWGTLRSTSAGTGVSSPGPGRAPLHIQVLSGRRSSAGVEPQLVTAPLVGPRRTAPLKAAAASPVPEALPAGDEPAAPSSASGDPGSPSAGITPGALGGSASGIASGVVSSAGGAGAELPARTGGMGGEEPLHRAELVARLQQAAALCYPAGARRFRLRGEGKVFFCADAQGHATGVVLKESTGASLLDDAATGCVLERAEPLPVHSGCYELPVAFGER